MTLLALPMRELHVDNFDGIITQVFQARLAFRPVFRLPELLGIRVNIWEKIIL
jgi:hypothetical protein